MKALRCNAFISVSNRHLALKNISEQLVIPQQSHNCVLLNVISMVAVNVVFVQIQVMLS